VPKPERLTRKQYEKELPPRRQGRYERPPKDSEREAPVRYEVR
jgi:hypothetical protein